MPDASNYNSQEEFHSACMSELVGEEGYDQEQANAICYSKWRDAKESTQRVHGNVLKEFIASDKSASDFISSIVEKQEDTESETPTQDEPEVEE